MSELSIDDDSTKGEHDILGNVNYCSKIEDLYQSPPFTLPIVHREDIDNYVSLRKGISSIESDEDDWIKALNYDDDDDVVVADEEWLPMDVEGGADEDDKVVLTQGDYDDEVGVVDELETEDKILKILDDYQVEDLVFGDADLKRKERILVERNNRGYYRCKVVHASGYNEITEAMKPYLTEECRKN